MENEELYWRMILSEEVRELIEKDHEINAYGVYLYLKNGIKSND